MLLETEENLQSLIVRILGTAPDLRFDPLVAKIVKHSDRTYTPQAIYQALRKLQRTGVITRASHRYSLSMPWVLRLLDFGQQVEEEYLKRGLPELMPEAGASITWRFYDLLRTDDFWNHLVLSILKSSGEKEMHEWIPHPWFDLATPGKEEQFMSALELAGIKFKMIIGGDSALDRRWSKNWPRTVFDFRFRPDVREFGRNLYLDVIGPFVISITLEELVAQEIDSFFDDTRTLGDSESRRLITILTNKTRVRLRLENNKRKADLYRKRINAMLESKSGGRI
jgi:hypothetical protein